MDGLTALLTSEARARVLTALYGEPGRSFYQQELARETKLPLIAVQRELRRLGEAGFIRATVAAGRRIYEADRDCSVYRELQSLVLKLRGTAAAVRQVLADTSKVRLAWIFGSLAAGSAGAASAIDLMVVGSFPARALRSALIPVERSLRRTVNEHVISAEEWTRRLARRDGFISEVRGGPKLWIVADEEGLRQLDPSRRR